MPSLNILIADDHAAVRRSLRMLLEARPGWSCAEAANGAEAVEAARELRPDVVLLDFDMPGLNGLEATRHILLDLPGASILILTMHDSDELRDEACRAGARGIMLKSEAGKCLVEAIRTAVAEAVSPEPA